MPDRHTQRILSHLADRRYRPLQPAELAEALSVEPEHRDDFTQAVAQLVELGQVVRGDEGTVGLPPPGKFVTGLFRKHPDGFGFIVPDQLVEHGDLFVPPGNTKDAMTGDRVRAKVLTDQRRASGGGKSPFVGLIIEVTQRADKRYAGTLTRKGKTWLVIPDGRAISDPIVVRDVGSTAAKENSKVVVELLSFGNQRDGELPEGVITQVLGEAGEPDVETDAVMHAFGLPFDFPPEVIAQAREAAQRINDAIPPDREDLTGDFIITIDPPNAKDFDDAISIVKLDSRDERDGAAWLLGVHIADVAHFVPSGSALDVEAKQRGNSTYLPRRVVPMLPELLSNGVCSLQPNVPRFAKSCYLRYDQSGQVLGERFARSVIKSAHRLTYLEAQALIDDDLREARKHCRKDTGGETHYPRPLIQALKQMDELARTIRQRRLEAGMIVLGLPAVELVFDDAGRVVDAHPEDDAFTHTLIEMFMVEANEAAARLFDKLDIPMVRRIHPEPDAHDVGELKMFARVAGYNIPSKPSRKELQQLLDSVRGKPAQRAVHIAVLRTLTKAEYSPMIVGHFALASEHYTHFTSPIRRYADLVVHRGIDAFLEAQRGHKGLKQIARAVGSDARVPDLQAMKEIGAHCSSTERKSEEAERELRSYLVLELMAEKLGEDFEGVVSGTTGSGVFIQLEKFLIDGFIKLNDIPAAPGDRWRLNRQTGALVAMRSGKTISIGDRFKVRIASVDLARRQMQLVIVSDQAGRQPRKEPRKQPHGAATAHDATRKLKKQRNDQKPGFRNKPTPGNTPGKTPGKKKRGRKRR